MSENKNKISEPSWKWRYQRGKPSISRNGSRTGKLIIQSIIAFAVAALFAFVFHRVIFAGIVAGIGLIILVCGLFIPRVYSAIERLIGVFAFGVGQFLTWLLLVPFYYLCFLPARIILSLSRRDPMKRVWDQSASTYWDKKRDLQGNNRMTNQY
jgi:TM2 domain-containing membrane protein YozV